MTFRLLHPWKQLLLLLALILFNEFGKVILYKIYDECSIIEHAKIALFRVKMKYDKGFTLYDENYITGDSELI